MPHLFRQSALARLPLASAQALKKAQPKAAPRRGPPHERSSAPQSAPPPAHKTLRLDHAVPQQGAVCAGGLDDRWKQGVYQGGEVHQEDDGRRDEAGRGCGGARVGLDSGHVAESWRG